MEKSLRLCVFHFKCNMQTIFAAVGCDLWLSFAMADFFVVSAICIVFGDVKWRLWKKISLTQKQKRKKNKRELEWIRISRHLYEIVGQSLCFSWKWTNKCHSFILCLKRLVRRKHLDLIHFPLIYQWNGRVNFRLITLIASRHKCAAETFFPEVFW